MGTGSVAQIIPIISSTGPVSDAISRSTIKPRSAATIKAKIARIIFTALRWPEDPTMRGGVPIGI